MQEKEQIKFVENQVCFDKRSYLYSGLLKRLDMREVRWSKSWSFSGTASLVCSMSSKVPMLESQAGCL